METDKLFHEFFQLVPHALFELYRLTPMCPYRFESPVLKASERRMDGLLVPTEPACPHFFLEVQGYRDNDIYWRMVHQVGAYHLTRAGEREREWRAVFLFLHPLHDPGPQTLGPLGEGSERWLLRGVLPELLAAAPESPMLNVLRPLAARDEQEVKQRAAGWADELRHLPSLDQAAQVRLVALLTQFVIERFTKLSWKEIETMLQLTPLEKTVAGQDLIRQATQENLLLSLETRFGTVPPDLSATIRQEEDTERLRALLRQVILANSLDEWVAALEA